MQIEGMVASISRTDQGFSVRRFIGALVVLVCLSAPVAGASGTVASTGSNAGSIGPIQSGVHDQTGPLVTTNGSIQINATASNQTRIELESVTLPKNGYIVARSGNLSSNTSTGGAILGHSQYVRHGNYSDVILNLNKTPKSAPVTVTIHNDTNGNRTWDGAKTDAAYQSAGGTPIHGTVRLKDANNRSQPQNTSNTTATVTFGNQTSNGSTITIQRATLPQPGFIAIHTASYADGLVGPNESIIAVSQRLTAGTHRNISVTISHAPPGNAPGLNRSQINKTGTFAATVYGDTNSNKQLDSVRSVGENDTLVTRNGSVVRDFARVRVPTPPRQTASVAIENQTLKKQNNRTLVVKQAQLPDGGFLVAHNASYQRNDDPLASVVGVSDYLSPGKHTNVALDVQAGALDHTQVVTIRPSRDTNDNQRYDFVRSQGFQDVAYENRTDNQSRIVTDLAQVRVLPSDQETQLSTQKPTADSTGKTPTTVAGDAGSQSNEGGSGGFGLVEAVGILVVVVGVILITREVR